MREFGRCEVTREAVLEFARDATTPSPSTSTTPPPQQSLFGRLAASGWHTAAMAMRMMCDGYLLDSASLGSPGIEKLSWPAPVYPATCSACAITVLESRPLASRPEVGLVKSRNEVLEPARPGGAEHGRLRLLPATRARGPAP